MDPTSGHDPESEGNRDDGGDNEVHVLSTDDRLRFRGQEFTDAIEALRETHSELAPAASELDSLLTIWDGTIAASKRLTEEDKERLRPVFGDVPAGGLAAHDLVDRLSDAVEDTEWGLDMVYNFVMRVFRPKREPIFHNAILISVVAAFEAHLSKLAEEYYRAAPDALHKVPREAAKEFSLRELQELGSIADAVEMAIEQRVTALMFGSLGDWKKFFADRLNIDLSDLIGNWAAVQEVFERRHCLVHNEAKASRRYVRAFPSTELQEPLDVDAEYVEQTLETLELLGVLVHAKVWAKFADHKQQVVDALESRGFTSLKEGRWQFSSNIYQAWQALPLTESEQRMAKVNLWISDKGINGVESIRAEVDAWDVSGSSEVYQFAKLCLLEDLDAAFDALPTMISRDHVAGKELATWPLLAPLRQDARIKQYADIMKDYLSEEAYSTADYLDEGVDPGEANTEE